MAGNLVLDPLKEGRHSDPYGRSSTLSLEGSFQEPDTDATVGTWASVRTRVPILVCIALSSVPVCSIHTCIVRKIGKVPLAYEEQPIGPGSCAKGLGTAERSSLCWGRLTRPPCAQTEQRGAVGRTALTGRFRSALPCVPRACCLQHWSAHIHTLLL